MIAVLTAQFAALAAPLRGVEAAPLLTLLLAPGTSADAATEAWVLRGMAADTARKLVALRASERAADGLAGSLAAARAPAASLHTDQVRQAKAIEQGLVVARRTADAAEARARDIAGRAATAASRTASLKDAIASLQSQRAGPRPGPGIAAGGVLAPVVGPVVQRYGAMTDAGAASGLTYAAAPSAPVSAPCRGQVDFAGPFRSYGKMVIVDCGRSVRFVLAGLDRLAVAPGVAVRAGQPIGRMPGAMAGTDGRPTLYVQLRRGAETADPGAYLRH